jgi:RNA polymerase sigma-70 factor (ECF subfamily)
VATQELLMTAPDLRIVSPARASDWTEAHIKALAESDVRMAMDMVTRKYRDRLFYHAVGITKDWEEAYDVVQEVFIRAMRETRLFQQEFRIKAWLFRVTSNLCFNLVRDRKRRSAILETFPQPDRAKADQVELVFKGERREEVLEAIGQMTRDHKEILLLRYYNDLSYAEIAAVLEVKLGTVMSRLSRARGRLMKVMGESQHLRS